MCGNKRENKASEEPRKPERMMAFWEDVVPNHSDDERIYAGSELIAAVFWPTGSNHSIEISDIGGHGLHRDVHYYFWSLYSTGFWLASGNDRSMG